jgi:heme A synthase
MDETGKETEMNVGRLIGGLICLAIAALLAILTYTLPDNEMMFMVGDQNVPLLPAVILGVVGVILLATVGSGKQADADVAAVASPPPAERIVPKGLWSIGVGLIMLGLNGARYAYGIRMSGFTTALGILSLIGGVTELLGLNSIEGPVLLIILGAYLVIKPWFEKRQLFGKAEQS